MSEDFDSSVPVPSPETEPFWAAAREERLVLPRCHAGAHWFPPSLACPRCGFERYSWVPATGRGTVFSFVVYHRAFKEKVPYVVAVIQLEEGPRLISNVVDIARSSGRVQARNCGAPASGSDFGAGLIRLLRGKRGCVRTLALNADAVSVLEQQEADPTHALYNADAGHEQY